MLSFIHEFWPHMVGVLTTLLSLITSANAVLHKRETHTAIGWVGLIWLAPLLGSVLYILLGINRIQRRATELRQSWPQLQPTVALLRCERATLENVLRDDNRQLIALGDLVDEVTNVPLTTDNAVMPLVNGDQAFPAMLKAIDDATVSVALSTYIFDNDKAGRLFADTLERAVARGVEVRVLIDGVGSLYSWPSIVNLLRKRGIPVARFLSSLLPWRMPYMNLRSHRKILVVDGRIGFTGGMNIRTGNLLSWQPKHPIQDLHFRLEGPVVMQMLATFAEDWAFSTKEVLTGAQWFPSPRSAGTVLARGIAAGPDADFDKLRWTILGALNQAQFSVRIVTPYFIPDQALVTALLLASKRGVKVDIILPEVNNLRIVQWASTYQLWQFLRSGCRISLTPPPFDHSKLMLVDDVWAFMGSANWDPRSLRLNFEFNIECYNSDLAKILNRLVDAKIAIGRQLTLKEVDGRSLLVKLRDGVAHLFSPYL